MRTGGRRASAPDRRARARHRRAGRRRGAGDAAAAVALARAGRVAELGELQPRRLPGRLARHPAGAAAAGAGGRHGGGAPARARGLLHGDLYAHNLLWDGTDGQAVLSDFGAASCPVAASSRYEKRRPTMRRTKRSASARAEARR